MSINIAAGSVAGVPAFGAVANISGANVVQILSAGAGLVRSLAPAAVGLGLGAVILAALAFNENQLVPAPKIPLDSSLVIVNTSRRKFWGIALDDEIKFECQNQLIAPLRFINRICVAYGFFSLNFVLETVDGSLYENIKLNSDMRFLTVLGKQTVTPMDLYSNDCKIQAATTTQVEQLKKNLHEALSYNLKAIIDLIGANVFDQFFQAKQFLPPSRLQP